MTQTMTHTPSKRNRRGRRVLAQCMAYALAIVGWGLLVASEAVAADAEATEGDAIVFWVKKPEMGGLNSVVGETLRFSYRTMDRTATAGDDYLAVNGMLALSSQAPAGSQERQGRHAARRRR